MTDRPIIFSAAMVRALLEGRKTQTRRILKPQPDTTSDPTGNGNCGSNNRYGYWAPVAEIRPYLPGDRLWVREAWRPHYLGDYVWDLDVSYPADGERRTIMDGEFGDNDWNWPKSADLGNVTPMHMPRWASRLTLTVTDVRVQRLQDISTDDAVAEGGPPSHQSIDRVSREFGYQNFPQSWFAQTWNTIHGPDAWDANPWVCALTFTVEKRNIDQ